MRTDLPPAPSSITGPRSPPKLPSLRVAGYEKEVAVLQRLRHVLETARSQARKTYLLPVMNELRPLLGLLFDDVSITFNEKRSCRIGYCAMARKRMSSALVAG